MVRASMPWREVGCGRPQRPAGSPLSRRARIASSLVALVAISGLTGCATDPPPIQTSFVAQQQPETELHARLDGTPELVVGGERLNGAALERFYARHDYEPVWATREAEANSLERAVLRAGDQGLDPDLFHARLLRHAAALPPLDRELVLSDAFLSYADALARGAVPVERRSDDEVLKPDPIDVAAVLDDAIGSPDPGAAIEALAPTTPTYLALRDVLQKVRTGASAGDKVAANRVVRTIEVNLERQRWLPRPLPANRAWVNVADQKLRALSRRSAGLLDPGRRRRRGPAQPDPGIQRHDRCELLRPAMGRAERHRGGRDPAED